MASIMRRWSSVIVMIFTWPVPVADALEDAPASEPQLCGCSWTERSGGCGISALQMLQDLEVSPVNRMCAETNYLGLETNDTEAAKRAERECNTRWKMIHELKRFKACPHMTAQRCKDQKQCQWGAQKSDECGIDEEMLLERVLPNPDLSNHPLVELTRIHDTCSEKSSLTCLRESMCHWDEELSHHCDISIITVYATLLEHPSTIALLQTMEAAAQCRAQFEHQDQPSCESPCVMLSGICMLSLEGVPELALTPSAMVRDLCSSESAQHECPNPCQTKNHVCTAPDKLPESFAEPILTESDLGVIEVFYAVQSATMVQTAQCRGQPELACKAAAPSCSHTYRPPWGNISDHMPAPGLNGVLGDFITSLSRGTAAKEFSEFLTEAPPRHIADIGSGFMRGLARFLEEDARRQAEREREARERDPKTPKGWLGKVRIPWQLAFVALLMAALCGGIATGALCSSGFGHLGFNEPERDIPRLLPRLAARPQVRPGQGVQGANRNFWNGRRHAARDPFA